MLLSLAVAIVKVIGMIYKIPITGMLTGQGMGYYNTAYNIYNVIFSLSTAGLPIAVAKLVAENVAKGRYQDAKKIFRLSATIFSLTGVIGFFVTFFGAKAFAGFMNNPSAHLAVAAISPAILFGCLMSAYRGYYQGLNDMKPTAFSEIIEALIKLLCGLGFAYFTFRIADSQYLSSGTVFGVAASNAAAATKLAMPYAAAASILGVSLSTAGGFLFLFLRHKLKGDGITKSDLAQSPAPQTSGVLVRRLLALAIPICLGAMMTNLTTLIDNMSIMNRLVFVLGKDAETLVALCRADVLSANGILLPSDLSALDIATKQEIANYLYGSFGYSSSLFALVPAITSCLGVGVLPTVTACWTLKDYEGVRKNTDTMLRICSLIAMPCGIGLSMLSTPVLQLLYGAKPEVSVAAPVLAVTAIGAIFASISGPIYSVMQGLGRPDIPVYIMAGGGIIKICVNFILVGIPSLNIRGAAWGTFSCYLFILIASLIALHKLTHLTPDFLGIFIKPGISALLCGITALLAFELLSSFSTSRLVVLVAVGLGAIVYLLSLGLLRALKKTDILAMPMGEKIAKILAKLHCLG
ncbi:MAG: polysaccharide biosynthesis protein [Oscillospiraceae bacterium]|nr:polysaccharide biosynthesis protein [Oscillospiraceae bacterium]